MIEASEVEVEALLGRRLDEVKLVMIYIDGMVFGDHTMVGAIGVDAEGYKHVLAIREGATENAAVAKELLEDLVLRGVNPEQKRLFVIDGSKALRGDQRGIWKSSSATVSRPQTAQCDGSLAGRPEGPSEVCDAGRLAAGCQGRYGPDEKAGRVAGTRLSFCRRKSDRRTGRVLYHQPAGCAALAASLLGHHQCHRESPFRRSLTDAPRLSLA